MADVPYDSNLFRRFLCGVFASPEVVDLGDGAYRYVFTSESALSLPAHVDSDSVTASLADDATWVHMRRLYPPPEVLEGV